MKFFSRGKRISFILLLTIAVSCNKLEEVTQQPELTPLDHGVKSSAAIAWCASLAVRAFQKETLPPNVVFEKKHTAGYSMSGLIYVSVTEDNPLPLNKNVGDIIIAGVWNGNNSGGVISILFADIDILSSESKFYGIHTIPVIKRNNGEIVTLFAEQDIVIGQGSDTIMQLGLSKVKFDHELKRLSNDRPDDVFVAVTQNVWHITLEQEAGSSALDYSYEVTGGGQILSASSTSGGVLYHAMINTKFAHHDCALNPLGGTAFIQNIQASSTLDLGNILLEFHSDCNGKAKVKLATGKYVMANGKDISLNWH